VLWCPLDPVAALEVVPGSHRWPTGLRGPGIPNPYLSESERIAASVGHSLVVPPGTAVVLDSATLHRPAVTSGRFDVLEVSVVPPTSPVLLHVGDSSGRVEVFESRAGDRPVAARLAGARSEVAPVRIADDAGCEVTPQVLDRLAPVAPAARPSEPTPSRSGWWRRLGRR
jgi:hypothetical protein